MNSSILSLDEELEKAYQRGFQDANLQVDQKINMLATEVYESVQNHLNRFQDQHLEKSNQEIKKLKQQLSTVQPLTSACDQQKNDLLQCLKGNPTTPLSCRIMVNSLTKCASESLRREQIS